MKRITLFAALALAAPVAVHAAQWIVPAAAHATGALDTNWRTDLRILNPGTATASATVVFLPANTDNSTPSKTAVVSIPAGGERTLSDVLLTSFQANGTGALLVDSSSSSLVVTSRTYNQPSVGGTYGQSLPGVPVAEALPARSTGYIYFVAKNSQYRTNIGVANALNQSGEVTIKLFSGAGTLLGETKLNILPVSQVQINDIYTAVGAVSGGTAHAEITATVPVIAYSSVVDNETGDPIALIAQRQLQAANVNYIPAIARSSGAAGSTWRSEVRFYNPTTQSSTVTMSLYPQGANPSAPLTRTFSLGGGQTLAYDDVVNSQFGQTSMNGGLKVESSQRIFVTSRTYNLSNRGTFGQDIPSFSTAEVLSNSGPARYSGLSDARFRTNFGFFNVSDVPLDVMLTMKNSNGTVLGQRIVHLEPTVMTQINDVFAFFNASGTSQASITATTDSPTGKYIAYGSVIDAGSGDPVFIAPVK